MHMQLSSSGAGWGAGSLDEDAEELNLLAKYLKQHFGSAVLPRPLPPHPGQAGVPGEPLCKQSAGTGRHKQSAENKVSRR